MILDTEKEGKPVCLGVRRGPPGPTHVSAVPPTAVQQLDSGGLGNADAFVTLLCTAVPAQVRLWVS